MVNTSDAQKDILTLRVDTPDSIKVNKELLTWELGDPLEEQAFTIEFLEPDIAVRSVKATNPAFEARVEEGEDKKSTQGGKWG